jgi:hypothetical protein
MGRVLVGVQDVQDLWPKVLWDHPVGRPLDGRPQTQVRLMELMMLLLLHGLINIWIGVALSLQNESS